MWVTMNIKFMIKVNDAILYKLALRIGLCYSNDSRILYCFKDSAGKFKKIYKNLF